MLTRLLTKTLLILLLNNQAKATSFQSISLTNLNLTTIKPTLMFNPNLPIEPMMCTPKTPLPTPPVGLVGTYLQQTQNQSRPFVSLLRIPAIFRPPPVLASGSSYSIEEVVCNTIARENVRSSTGVLYLKTFWANHVDKARLELVRQIESKQHIPILATTISVNDPSDLVNH